MIYFDHNSTTPLDPEVGEVINEANQRFWGNPSSLHSCGRAAFGELERARERLAAIINASAEEIVFTSGGTESNNLAVLGSMDHNSQGCFVHSQIEHPSVISIATQLKKQGRQCHSVSVDSRGVIVTEELLAKKASQPSLVSVMAANNEIGTLQPVKEIAEMFADSDILVHSDAVQAFGKIALDVNTIPLDLMSLSSHKLNGPKGVGALYVRKGVRLVPRFFGGHQEREIRPGTENLPLILGFVRAAELSCGRMERNSEYLFELTEYLFNKLSDQIEGVLRNGDAEKRLPGTLNVTFKNIDAQVMIAALDQEGVCISGGSACQSGAIDPSKVLLAMGRRYQEAACSVRFSLSSLNTREEVDYCVEAVVKIVKRVRGLN
ncbi:cysteine desulfurase family protein [Chitinispirillales bacterium ANBcel5]|uniref:cysteine desulfurase family protein n=1 Tax=Cellulosispirillum alkaliphilum TaxID=3039283 RepID=UPI002A53D0A7|nr:cysteine desulfurase family protein [Chitinispirillales bacterium ANBcel5]